MNMEDKEKILKAGNIVSKVREYARTIVKPGIPLIEIAEKIEAKIAEFGGKPAFPTTFSINEITAHCTPGLNDSTIAHGLIKVDFGVHVGGWTADNAFSVDLENSEENRKLIAASEEALNQAIDLVKKRGDKLNVSEIGSAIQRTIEAN